MNPDEMPTIPPHTWLEVALAAILTLLAWTGCSSDEPPGTPSDTGAEQDSLETDAPDVSDPTPEERAVADLSPTAMKAHIDTLADDALGGRIPGSATHIEARDYVRDQMAAIGLEPFGDDGGYLNSFPMNGVDDRFQRDPDGTIRPNTNDTGYNLVGRIAGSDLADEVIVFMAHYDHLGVDEDGDVFNGAFDDAGGVAVVLEVARVLIEQGITPRRSIVFLVTDGEEVGLEGAQAWIADPPIPRDQIVMGISADPLGRRLLPDYGPIVLVGLERSPDLLDYWRQTQDFSEADVVFIHRRMIPVFASDQDEFHAQGVPAGWFITPGMTFYHTVDDEADTIDYRMLLEAARYITRSILLMANDDARFDYVGEPDLEPQHAADARTILAGILTSTYLTEAERDQIEGHIATLDAVIEAGSWDVVNAIDSFFFTAMGLAAFQLPRRYPGPIPPPFPGE